jgi:formate dehydrogenase major subunit
MVQLVIDGQSVQVPEGTTLWQAAQQAGIEIPTLCHDPRLRPVGVCRLCLVSIGRRMPVPACAYECEPDLVVETRTKPLEKLRKSLLRLLLADHPIPCAKETTTADCKLEEYGRQYGLLDDQGRLADPFLRFIRRGSTSQRVDLSSPVIRVDHEACILCDRCIRACNEVQCNDVIARSGKGFATDIAFDLGSPLGASSCVACGECVQSCPTGALTNRPLTVPLRPRNQLESVPSVCPYCGVGCTVTYFSGRRHIVWAEGRMGPGSDGRLCVKGRYGWDYNFHPHRLRRPLLRRSSFYPKGPLTAASQGQPTTQPGAGPVPDYERALEAFEEVSWDEALECVAEHLTQIRAKDGPGALAGFGSAKCSNEEAYLFQKFVRAVFGNNNVDHCTRLCHASSVAALLEGIGSGAVTNIFRDVERSDLLLVTGSNTTANHPVAATFFKQAVRRGKKLIVVDCRRLRLADFATYYCPIFPGSDVAFYNALMHVLIRDKLYDEAFVRNRTAGFESLAEVVAHYPPERVAPWCGVSPQLIEEVAHVIGRAKAMLIFWGMGISQHIHGTDNARCLIALALLTGSVGRPGTGLHPLRGQNNVQGASDAGLIPMVYPDYQPVSSPEVRHKFEEAWGVSLDPNPGLTVVEITNAILAGQIKGMLMMGENPFLSDPNIHKVRKALSSLEFLAVQDIFLTETAEFADVVLPSASFFEKTGTYTNTDRRVQLGRKVVEPPGEARPDWQILCDLAGRMGYPMAYGDTEEVFREFASLTYSYRGLTYESLGLDGKIWPIPDPRASETPILFSERFPTPDGRGRFVPCHYGSPAEWPDAEYPFVLNTGRLLEHWHTGTMTRRSRPLHQLASEPYVEMHPADAAKLGLQSGQLVCVSSRRGSIVLKVLTTDALAPGCVFIPFHFREAAANLLTTDALDPYGKIPELKFCAVRIDPV